MSQHGQIIILQVLTMSWEGDSAPKVSNIAEIVAQGMRPADVAELMLKSFGMMMFEHGFVHADPHPGNLLVRRNPNESLLQRITRMAKHFSGLEISYSPQLVILDHGLYVDIPRDVRRDWCLLWRSLVLGHRQILNDVSSRLMPSGGGILTAALSFGFALIPNEIATFCAAVVMPQLFSNMCSFCAKLAF
jgi:hypothetical protein